ncbi:MAG: hypothetical protein NTZ50_05930 [Chloroflexi bacterium]|nr:hypothetical protein [Chloroflexota bacterium]
MESKVFFGLDFIHVSLEIGNRSGRESDDYIAVAKLLLLLGWELTSAQVKQAEAEFWKRNEAGTLDRLASTLSRLIENLKNDIEAKERIIVHALVMSMLEGAIAGQQAELIGWLVQYFAIEEQRFARLQSSARNVMRALNVLRERTPDAPGSGPGFGPGSE